MSIAKYLVSLCATFLLVIALGISSNAQIQRPIGINLTGIVDYSAEYEFVDAFKQTREWIAHDLAPGSPWSSDVQIPLRPDGYPKEIPYDDGSHPLQGIRTLMFFGDLEGVYPSGKYRLTASGTGQISLWGAASGTFQCPVDTMVDVDSQRGGIALEIERSDKSDPIHDIHFILPGFDQTYETDPFYPGLLDFLKDFQVIRFMDWMMTNDSPVESWEDRNTPDYYTQTLGNGIAYEYIIDLCNRTGKDAWICVPHRANDAYIDSLATLFKNGLDKERKVYVEYSNEVWNGIFEQNRYAAREGLKLGYSGEPWERSWQYYAKRTADVHRIFEEVFKGEEKRLVKVIASQASNPWVTNYILEHYSDSKYNPSGVKADALATAPYFGGAVGRKIGDAHLANTITVEAILDSMENALEEAFEWMDGTKRVADRFHLDHIAYEGGQHLIAGWEYNNNEAYVNKLLDANRHPRMEDLYCQYFDHWYEVSGGGLFANFSSHGNYSKWGSWGVKESYEDTLAPKYLGLKHCVFKYNPDVMTNGKDAAVPDDYVVVHPNPTSDGCFVIQHRLDHPRLQLYDALGNLLVCRQVKSQRQITVSVPAYHGVCFAVLEDGKQVKTLKVTIQ